jgi:hypothetical protein
VDSVKHSGHFKPAGQDPRRGKGGKRKGAGRPTNEEKQQRLIAAERARERIEAEVDAIVDEYTRLAKGGKVKKGSSPTTIRHCVERWIPAARQGVEVNVNSPEKYFKAIQEARRRQQEKALFGGKIHILGAAGEVGVYGNITGGEASATASWPRFYQSALRGSTMHELACFD